MGSFGERLQRERMTRKISLEEIAAATKIGTRNLRALETEDFDSLPGGIFNRGFVRSYARFLGMDEELAVAEYLAAEGGRYDNNLPFSSEDVERRPINFGAWARLLLFVLVLAGAAYAAVTYSDQIAGFWRHLLALRHLTIRVSQANAEPLPPGKPAAVVPAASLQSAQVEQTHSAGLSPVSLPVTQAAAEPAAATFGVGMDSVGESGQTPKREETPTAPAADLPSAKPQAMGQFVVHVRARQETWLSINADGRKLMEGTLSASAERSFRAAHNMVLVTGNAGGVEVSFNGKLLPTLGAEKQPKKLLFTEEGPQR